MVKVCQVLAVALPRMASVVQVERSFETWSRHASAKPVYLNIHRIVPMDFLAPRSNQT